MKTTIYKNCTKAKIKNRRIGVALLNCLYHELNKGIEQ